MSNCRQRNGDDYPEASDKHVQDSITLLQAARYDGAGYLAGYAIECILKTIAVVEGHPMRGHDINQLKSRTLNFLSLPSARTAKYITNPAVTTLNYGNGPHEWTETIRYQKGGMVSQADASAWVNEASRLYRDVINQMILDGVIVL